MSDYGEMWREKRAQYKKAKRLNSHKCKHCGSVVWNNDSKCFHCGAKNEEFSRDETLPEPSVHAEGGKE